jgi:hypothetical protein
MYPSSQNFVYYLEELSQLGVDMHNEGVNPFAPENIARFKALDMRYNHEVFYEQMPAFYGEIWSEVRAILSVYSTFNRSKRLC